MKKTIRSFFLPLVLFSLFFLTGCDKPNVIVNNVEEREANQIVVYLATKGIEAVKIQAPSAGGAAGGGAEMMFNISVDEKQSVEAMAALNQGGLPRKKSTTLLDLFAKSGLVSSEKEERIRYQAGLAAQIAGTIRKIDGVLDADVELSIPQDESAMPGAEAQAQERVTAAVYVKHQGILDDPNSHLVTKIKRLLAGSVAGLTTSDVTVISDRAWFADVSIDDMAEEITPAAKEYVSIWSIVMSKGSATRFRLLFFTLFISMILFVLFIGWMIWKFYPLLRKRGFKNLFSPTPFRQPEEKEESETNPE